MTARARAAALALAFAGACSGPDISDGSSDICGLAGAEPDFDPGAEPCERLSSYGFFADAAAQVPAEGVLPYDVNTPLFSDYAAKHRFVWMPPGAAARYRDEGALEFPVGAVLIKTFGYLADLRDPGSPEHLIETRLLVRGEDGWEGLVYQWDEAQTEAVLAAAGGRADVSWIHHDGSERQIEYLVPNVNQCKNCHENAKAVLPIGPKAAHLNRDHAYEDGVANQLSRWSEVGYLEGAPAPAEAPRTPVWNDPETGDVAARARAWLDVNCAHCHNPEGPARTSGLDLRQTQEQPFAFGVCKGPVAAGDGSGGRQYGIVPGDPDASILVYRIESNEPDVRMPELLRQTVDEEGVALVREWIAGMEGSCGAE